MRTMSTTNWDYIALMHMHGVALYGQYMQPTVLPPVYRFTPSSVVPARTVADIKTLLLLILQQQMFVACHGRYLQTSAAKQLDLVPPQVHNPIRVAWAANPAALWGC